MSIPSRLEHYLTTWGLADARPLTRTRTSDLYLVSSGAETAVLKLLAPSETEEQRGALALRCFDGHGAVRLLRHDEGAQLLEYAAGDELITLVERGDDDQATRLIAAVLDQLHSVAVPAATDGLVTLERWFRALFARAAEERDAGRDTIYTRGAACAEALLAQPRDVRVLHGDIHHRNIRQSPRGWLAFDPKGLVGERTYDCANALCNPPLPEIVHSEARLLAQAGILARALDLDPKRVLAFTYAYACLNASWWEALDGPEMVAWSLAVARVVEPHVVSR